MIITLRFERTAGLPRVPYWKSDDVPCHTFHIQQVISGKKKREESLDQEIIHSMKARLSEHSRQCIIKNVSQEPQC